MRRIFSILLVLIFGFGPLAVAVPGTDDTHLPACCRRHGAHHCAMGGETATSSPVFEGPRHCPQYPGGASATISPIHALAPAVPKLAGHISGLRPGLPARIAPYSPFNFIFSVRGPPASIVA